MILISATSTTTPAAISIYDTVHRSKCFVSQPILVLGLNNELSNRWTAAEYKDEVYAVERHTTSYLQEILSRVIRTVSELLSHSWFT